MDRRRFLSAVGAGTAVALAGCTLSSSGDDEDNGSSSDDDEELPKDEDDELTVATYGSFVDAETSNPSEWLKSEFESTFDATLTYVTPDSEINHYIEQTNAGESIDADVYLGVTTDELITVDENAEDDLFESGVEVPGQENVKDGLAFDPESRAIPHSTGYISLVYDSTQTSAPETFEGLLDDEHSGNLITQDPGTSNTGRAFLLHTIKAYGPDGYLDYWESLQDNDVRILGSWSDAYNSWESGEAPMVVSYSTDQVFAAGENQDLDKHQIRFLNDQAYANPEGVAVFADAPNPNLSRDFLEFILRPEVQGEIAQQNVAFPATTDATLPEDYDELAHEPPEPVTFTYDELQGSLSEWIEDWERQIAGK